MILDLEDTFTVGEDTFFGSTSPTSSYGVVFEDDLSTGYFYAIDVSQGQKIMDAVHIYNVANVTDKAKPCIIKIAWTDDGHVASLLINNYCHAIFDFENKEGYCRTAFPDTNGDWALNADRKITNRKLTDKIITEKLTGR